MMHAVWQQNPDAVARFQTERGEASPPRVDAGCELRVRDGLPLSALSVVLPKASRGSHVLQAEKRSSGKVFLPFNSCARSICIPAYVTALFSSAADVLFFYRSFPFLAEPAKKRIFSVLPLIGRLRPKIRSAPGPSSGS